MRARLKDIANYLNVSVTTVSRALNDKGDISDAMKKKVLEVADMLDYKPNSIAISLRKKTASDLIGIIVPTVDHYFFSTIIRGVTTSQLEQDEYMIMIGESNHDVQREKELINKFQDHYVAGIILAPTRHASSIKNVRALTERKTPLVLIDRTFESYDGSYIQYDDYQGGYAAAQHLISKGRTKIALLKGDQECSVSSYRERGFRDALKQSELEIYEDFIKECPDASREEGYQRAQELFGTDFHPDGIMTITDQLAVGVLSYMDERSISAPEDLSVMGYSNSEISKSVTPKLTTINQDGFEIGRLAKEYLIRMCHSKEEGLVLQKTFNSDIIVRAST